MAWILAVFTLLLAPCIRAREFVVKQPAELFIALNDPLIETIIVEADLDLLPLTSSCFSLSGQDLVLLRNVTITGLPGQHPAISWRWGGNCTWAVRLAANTTLTFRHLTLKQVKGYVPDIVAGGDPSSYMLLDNVIVHRYTAIPPTIFLGLVPSLMRPSWAPGNNKVALLPEGACRTQPQPLVCWNNSLAVIDFADTFVSTTRLGQPNLNARLRLTNCVQVIEQYLTEECASELFSKGNQECVRKLSAQLQEQEAATGTGWIQVGASPERVAKTQAALATVMDQFNQPALGAPPPATVTRTIQPPATTVINTSSASGDDNDGLGKRIGAIVGGIVGGVVLLALIALGVWAALRRRHAHSATQKASGVQLESSTSDDQAVDAAQQAASNGGKVSSLQDVKRSDAIIDIEADSQAATDPAPPSPGKASVECSPGPMLTSTESAAALYSARDSARAASTAGIMGTGTVVNTQLLLLDNNWLKLNEMVTPHTPLITPVLPDLTLGQNLVLNHRLGAGSMGSVYQGTFQGQAVAVKLFGPGTDRTSFISELSILGRTQHPNVVRLLGACISDQQLALVEELADGSLEQVLYCGPDATQPAVRLPLDVVLHIAMEVATGLAYLHPTIIHRDLKPGNILLMKQDGLSSSDTPRWSAGGSGTKTPPPPPPQHQHQPGTTTTTTTTSTSAVALPPPVPDSPDPGSCGISTRLSDNTQLGSPSGQPAMPATTIPADAPQHVFPASGAWLQVSMSDVTNSATAPHTSPASPETADMHQRMGLSGGDQLDWDGLQVKLSDFGLSRLFDSATLITQTPHAGTIPYMAPECFERQVHGLTHKCDIYSFSIVLWELLHCMRPWIGFTPAQVVYEVVVNQSRPLIYEAEDRVPSQLRGLIERCWNPDPDCRPPALEIVRELAVAQHQHQQLLRQPV